MIDKTKPLQLSDGTPATYVEDRSYGFTGFVVNTAHRKGMCFNADGSNDYGYGVTLQNVRVAFDPTKPVQTRDGRPARILATDLKGPRPIAAAVRGHHSDRDYVYEIGADGRMSVSAELPEDLVNVPEVKASYHNVYKSTVGRGHATLELAQYRGNGGTRQGYLKLTRTDGVPTSAEIVPA